MNAPRPDTHTLPTIPSMEMHATLKTIWRIAAPYFSSADKWAGRGLLAAIIAIELSTVGITVLLNQWNNRFYNALQDRNWDTFVSELIFFCVLAAAYIALAVYQLYLNQWLQIRWRKWLTAHYLEQWLHRATHYRMQLTGDAADNPDQRLTEDVQVFVERTLSIGVGLLSSVVTLLSFVVILWGLSQAAPLVLFGGDITIPGYLVWAALIYAVLGTWLTHLVGWPLIGLNFHQQRFEADFRFNLVRVRENSEQIALLTGEAAERARLNERFGRVVENFKRIMSRQKKLTAFTASYSQASVVFPFIMAAPAYFAGKIQLGALMQTASAFNSVQGALSFFITIYRQWAEWQSVVVRLDGFEQSILRARAMTADAPERSEGQQDAAITLHDLDLTLPDGAPLVAARAITLDRDARILITGPSGSGKSTLFRAIAGIWPFGKGRIAIPQGASLMLLPQRPYFPTGALRDAIAYPAPPNAQDDAQLRQALTQVGLPALGARLDEHNHWNRTLSLGEQQRLGLARVLLQQPDVLFLDEATASLDEPSEAALYKALAALPNTTIVSIGHRSTLRAFHDHHLEIARTGERHELVPASGPHPAASGG